MYNGRSHATNQNGAAAKTKPVDKSKVNILVNILINIQRYTLLKALVAPPYPSSVARPLAPWPRDQGEVSELYKVR